MKLRCKTGLVAFVLCLSALSACSSIPEPNPEGYSLDPDFEVYPLGTRWVCATLTLPPGVRAAFGVHYSVERWKGGKWSLVKEVLAGDDIGYRVPSGFRLDFYIPPVDWVEEKKGFDTVDLPAGRYRIVKWFTKGDYGPEVTVYGYFTIR